jgi:hypothetical protein
MRLAARGEKSHCLRGITLASALASVLRQRSKKFMTKDNKELREKLKDLGYKPEVVDKIIDSYVGSPQKKKLP